MQSIEILTNKEVPKNPPLYVGKLYVITDVHTSDEIYHVGTVFLVCSNNHIQYLTNTATWDKAEIVRDQKDFSYRLFNGTIKVVST